MKIFSLFIGLLFLLCSVKYYAVGKLGYSEESYRDAKESFEYFYGDTLDLVRVDEWMRIVDKRGKCQSDSFCLIDIQNVYEQEGFFVVSKCDENGFGVMDACGNTLIPFAYKDITYIYRPYCRSNQRYFECWDTLGVCTIYDMNYNALFSAKYDAIRGFADNGYSVAEIQDTFYIIDMKGNSWRVKGEYTSMDLTLRYDDYIVTHRYSLTFDPFYVGAVDYKGEIILPCVYRLVDGKNKQFSRRIKRYIRKKKRREGTLD